jgi:hypothetical protein
MWIRRTGMHAGTNGPGMFVVYHGGMPPTMCIWEEIGKAFVRFDKNIKTEKYRELSKKYRTK